MENFPKPENSQEKIEKGKVLEMLRAHGFEHTETRAMVIKWTEQQEALQTNENARKARISLEIERADLYVAVGDIEEAFKCLNQACRQANEEDDEELYSQAIKKMDEIDEAASQT